MQLAKNAQITSSRIIHYQKYHGNELLSVPIDIRGDNIWCTQVRTRAYLGKYMHKNQWD